MSGGSRAARASLRTAAAAVLGTALIVWGTGSPAPPVGAQGPAQPGGRRLPKLVVFLIVDQMRGDYIERFQKDWTGGLRRLVTDGAWFERAAFPYLTTVTCPGHATLSTGALPPQHGIFQNTWFDRASGTLMPCTSDPEVRAISYGPRRDEGHSPKYLRLPTLSDELRQGRNARVVSISLKARSAIMMAGRGGTAVTWFGEPSKSWETSSAYSPAPVPAVKAFLDASPIEADFKKVWTYLLAPERYEGRDEGDGEAPPVGWTKVFPHALSGRPGDTRPEDAFYTQWERSPFANDYLGRMAAALTASLGLGTRNDATDFLAVSFSSTDLVGHAFGPRSHEVQDLYARLDRTIGELFSRLDTLVGRGDYIVGLSADHGVADLPHEGSERRGGGRLSSPQLGELVERVARAALGPGRFVARAYSADIYFEPGAYEKLAALPSAMTAVLNAIDAQPGIARVFRREELADGASSADPAKRAAALSYVPRLSGDLVVVPEEGWMFTASGTTHGSANAYDQRVPVIVMGPGVKPGRYADEVTPADLAPTLASLAGITMRRAEGHVLQTALLPR